MARNQKDQWAEMLKRLQVYQQEHDGSCNVPAKYPPDQQLGIWVHKQRFRYKKGLLAKERCDQLEAIGFEWTRSGGPEWAELLKRLQAYQKEHDGSCDVPAKYPPDQQLGKWVHYQRACHKKDKLAKDRFDQLEEMGFTWTRNRGQQPMHDQWTLMLKRLQTYQREHDGSCNVPRGYRPDPKLGIWVNNQRAHHRKGLLAKERFDQLEAIGFEWTRMRSLQDQLQDQFTKMLKRLQAYQQEHDGSCDVPQKYHPDLQLGSWVNTQRQKYKKGLLAKDRCDQLEAMGFQWRLGGACNRERRDRWTKMLNRLQAYQQEHDGNCNVPQQYRQDMQLGSWVNSQRQKYKKGLLAKERCDQLEAMGFQWRFSGARRAKMQSFQERCDTSTRTKREQSLEDHWTKMLNRLQAYQQEHDGNCNVPYRYRTDPQLGAWVVAQRRQYKKGSLTKERYDQLEEIGFEWTGKREQHQKYKKSLLGKERCDQLEAMGFQWRLKDAQASTQLQSPLPKVSKTKQTETLEPVRWCWL